MAVTLQRASQQCTQLVNCAASQLQQERAADPLSAVTLVKLKELAAGVKKVATELKTEEKVFSSDVDLSGFASKKLSDMSADIREASRKLSIVLAAGSNRFRAQLQDDATSLQSLQSYFHPSVARDLNLDELIPVLRPAPTHCPCGYPWGQCCGLEQTRVATITFRSSDFQQGHTAAETMQKLAKRFQDMQEHCEKTYNERKNSAAEKGQKEEAFRLLQADVKKLAPELRKHVLRIGIGKGQHLNISSGCGNVATITNMFDYATVENAHRQLEDGRDRILQELTLRKLQAKMRAETPEKDSDPAKRRKLNEYK